MTKFALTLVLLVSIGASALAQGGYTTRSFDVQMRIEEDRTLDITEVISVNFTGRRRGLIRWIPTSYPDRSGQNRRIYVELIGVRQLRMPSANWREGEGERAKAQASISNGKWGVRIGDPNIYLTGPVRYTIRYRVNAALTDFDGDENSKPHTELYWNPIPHEWATGIERASVNLSFPNKAGETPPSLKVWMGPIGSKKGIFFRKPGPPDSTTGSVSGLFQLDSDKSSGSAVIKTTASLPKAEGISVALALAKDSVTWVGHEASIEHDTGSGNPISDVLPPQLADPAGYVKSLPSDPIGWIPLLGPLAVIVLYRIRRKSAPVGPIVTRFDPPEGIGAAECGVVTDRQFDVRDFVAAVASLGSKGVVRLSHASESGKGDLNVELTGRPPTQELTAVESEVYRSLERHGPVVTPALLKHQFGSEFNQIRATADRWWSGMGYERPGSCGIKLLSGCGALLLMIVLAVVVFRYGPLYTIGACVVGIIACLIGLAGKSPLTALGAKARNQVLGLREFIARAKKDEFNYAIEKAPAQVLYENLLPYAIAFGLVNEWTRQFDGIQLFAPDWYDSGYGNDVWVMSNYLANDLDSIENEWLDAVSSPPPVQSSGWSSGDSSFSDFGSSSGGGDFSGGGDSGGGGGGGGGDSW